MLGSHNSLSYLPIKGWKKILKPWIKCQDKTIEEQYNSGVRYFDIRVRKKDNSWWYCHNDAIFVPVIEHKEILEFLIEKESYVRIILDVRKEPKNAAYYKGDFFELVIELIHKGLRVDSIIVYWEWKDYYTPNNITQHEYHSSVSAPWYKYILGTKWFAKHYNEKYLKENETKVVSENDVVLMDYL